MYDKKMWDDDGALIQPPTFRAVADIVLDIVGNATGQKWIGYLDDALFATLDLTGGYKTPAEVGLELGKKALTSAASYGISSLGSAASAAASAAITNTAANVAAQAGISMVQSYATSVATSAINSVNLVNGELKFDGEGFGKSLYSASTIGGALGAGVTAGLNEYSLGARTVDGLDADGNAIKTIEYTRAQGLNSTQIDNMGKFNSLMGGLSSSAVSFAMDGKATFNILNASDLGIKSNTGLFELTVGKDGISSTIGSGGTNISMGNLMASLNGAKATVKNAQINNTVNKNYKGNMNVANMLRAQYGFGDKVQLDQLDSILKGNTELRFGNTTDGKAQTVDENGKRIVHMNMDQNGDWKMGAIMLGHESYRDGIVSSADAQLAETRAAVKGHTEMTLRMMGDNLYAASMSQLVGSNQNLQMDLIAYSFGEDRFNRYIDDSYDSSSDYWKLISRSDGTHSIEWDGSRDITIEYQDKDKNGEWEKVGQDKFDDDTGSMSGSLGKLLGKTRAEEMLGSSLYNADLYDAQTLKDVLGLSDEKIAKIQRTGVIPSDVSELQLNKLAGEALMKKNGISWDTSKGENKGFWNVSGLSDSTTKGNKLTNFTLTDNTTMGYILFNQQKIDPNLNAVGNTYFDRFVVTSEVIRYDNSWNGKTGLGKSPSDSKNNKGLDTISFKKWDLKNNQIGKTEFFFNAQTVDVYGGNSIESSLYEHTLERNTIISDFSMKIIDSGFDEYGLAKNYEPYSDDNYIKFMEIHNATALDGTFINKNALNGKDYLRWLVHDSPNQTSMGCFIFQRDELLRMQNVLHKWGLHDNHQIKGNFYRPSNNKNIEVFNSIRKKK